MRTIRPYEGITVTFDEGRHRFSVNGKPTVSVTSVTGIIDKSGPLMHWAVKLAVNHLRERFHKRIDEGELLVEADFVEASRQHRMVAAKAASTGTIVHEYAEQYALGNNPKMPEERSARNGAVAFLNWVEQSGMVLRNPEQLVYSKAHDYAGIADAEATQSDKLYLIDFKTSSGIYNEYRYQVAAYLHALIEMNGGGYDGYWILRFDKGTGGFTPLFVSLEDSKADFAAFLGALAVKRCEDQLNYRA